MNDKDHYNKLERDINQKLSTGISREEAAKEFEYKTWKSLDVFMRRRGNSWNSEKNIYVKNDTELVTKRLHDALMPEKARKVIDLFSEGVDDLKTIVEKAGFEDQRKMAEYMRENGFSWSGAEKNYIYQNEKHNGVKPLIVKHEPEPIAASIAFPRREDSANFSQDFGKYIPILEFLLKNQDKLQTLIEEVSENNRVSKYAVPGTTKTKSFYMSDKLSNIVSEFSELKKLTQREIVESALVEYLKRYGFSREIERLMKAA